MLTEETKRVGLAEQAEQAEQRGSFAVKWQIVAKSERRYQLSEVYLEDRYSMRIEM